MPYKDREKERACGRRRYERITAERIAGGMCPRCGKARPAPDRTLCRHCGEKRRKAERARCAKAKAAGIQYGGRDPERCRAFARDRSRRRDRARWDARTCMRCGTHPPIEGGTVCEPCHVARRDREREQYAARACRRFVRPVRHAGAQRCRLLRPVRQERRQTLKKKGEGHPKPVSVASGGRKASGPGIDRGAPYQVDDPRESSPCARRSP